ncbi:hypothetical protein ISCGN_022444 [Ixodes scapularis]
MPLLDQPLEPVFAIVGPIPWLRANPKPQSSFHILVRAGAEPKACFSECVGRSEFRKSVSSRKNCRWLEDADQLPVWIVAINSAKACSRISPTCFSAAIQDRMLCER